MGTDLETLQSAYDNGIRLLDGWRPQPSDLAGAPTILDWSVPATGSGLFALTGRIVDDAGPETELSLFSRWSCILWLDRPAAFALTIRRIYRLGSTPALPSLPDNESWRRRRSSTFGR
jgi:hypothetical protein